MRVEPEVAKRKNNRERVVLLVCRESRGAHTNSQQALVVTWTLEGDSHSRARPAAGSAESQMRVWTVRRDSSPSFRCASVS